MTQPIQAVQICYEHPFGTEREVLREFFSFAGCLVKTTMMPVETMLEKHKSLVDSGSERIAHLFLTDRSPEGITLSKNEMWCSFRILKQELTINKKAILHNADQKISAEQFEKAALDVIIRRIWKDEICKEAYSSRYMSRNRKHGWDSVSFTIPAMAKQVPLWPGSPDMVKVGKDLWQFGEKGSTRRLSYREAAAIQTFPKDMVFYGNLMSKYKQIGNAVPCEHARVVGTELYRNLILIIKNHNK